MMKNNTFIYLWRSILDTSFYKNPLTCHLAIHLMLSAAWKDHKIMVGGKEVLIMRGQVPTGRNKLSEETGLSPQNIRTCLKHLKKCGFLTIKSTKQLSIITLCKYNSYQKYQPTVQPTIQPTPNQRLTNDQPLQNKGNKEKNIKIKEGRTETAKAVIDFLNSISGKNFGYGEANLEPIRGRLADGFPYEDFETVMKNKWNDEKFDKKYFRPATLFRPANFEAYLNENLKTESSPKQQKPICAGDMSIYD